MNKCLILVEGPFDKLRLDCLLDLFKEDKIVILPLGGDLLTSKNYYRNHKKEIISLLNKEKGYAYEDFNEIIEVIDTDGCFISSKNILENPSISKIKYFPTHIEALERESIIKMHQYKAQNVNKFLKFNKMKLYYNSVNIDHAFDNISNLTNSTKRKLALTFLNKYSEDLFSLLDLLFSINYAKMNNYLETWKYIKSDLNSLKRSSNIFIFILEHFDDLKDEFKDYLISKRYIIL